MRYHAPAREAVDPMVFERMPLAAWCDYFPLLRDGGWPDIDRLNQHLPADAGYRFVAQTPALLADGMHYEQRIAERGEIATREHNWHDLLNALIWLRHAPLKQALNRRQMLEIASMGARQRSRAQYAMTHFDEAGVIVWLRDASLMPLWDAHDWRALFWQRREAWRDGSIRLELFGHAVLEHALSPDKLLVGKALAFVVDDDASSSDVCRHAAAAIAQGELLRDPLELRPLPLSGLPGWLAQNESEAFHRDTICYQPRRAGRAYPPANTFVL
jgi:hypothetical protein